jgi:hypothetical protein
VLASIVVIGIIIGMCLAVGLGIALALASLFPLMPASAGLGNKTAWDLLGLLNQSILIALVTFAFAMIQNWTNQRFQKQLERERGREEDQRDAQSRTFQLQLEQQRRELEERLRQSELSQTRLLAHRAAMQDYIGRISALLPKLRNENEKEVRRIARARTLTLLSGLDGAGRGEVALHLAELGLISREKPIIGLRGAMLGEARFEPFTELKDLDFSGGFLVGAQLVGVTLRNTSLAQANLTGATFSSAGLYELNLDGANLSEAKLNTVTMEGGSFKTQQMAGADLSYATLRRVDLRGADFGDTTLTDTVFEQVTIDETTRGLDVDALRQAGLFRD